MTVRASVAQSNARLVLAGSAGNRHGYEDGSVVRVGNTTHMFVSAMVGDPMWIKMRLEHWQTDVAR